MRKLDGMKGGLIKSWKRVICWNVRGEVLMRGELSSKSIIQKLPKTSRRKHLPQQNIETSEESLKNLQQNSSHSKAKKHARVCLSTGKILDTHITTGKVSLTHPFWISNYFCFAPNNFKLRTCWVVGVLAVTRSLRKFLRHALSKRVPCMLQVCVVTNLGFLPSIIIPFKRWE